LYLLANLLGTPLFDTVTLPCGSANLPYETPQLLYCNNTPTHPRPEGHERAGTTYTLLLQSHTPVTESEDARVHCAVLNVRPDTGHPTPPNPSPPRRTTRQGQPRRADGGTRCRPALNRGATNPRHHRGPRNTRGWSAPSGPNSVPTNRTIPATTFHTRSRGPY
jgi:hypothetical protein